MINVHVKILKSKLIIYVHVKKVQKNDFFYSNHHHHHTVSTISLKCNMKEPYCPDWH